MEISRDPILSCDGIISRAVEHAASAGLVGVAVAQAADEAALEAVAQAVTLGICRPLLFGDAVKIGEIASRAGLDLSMVETEHHGDPESATRAAVRAAHEGRAGVIMKGFVGTASLLRTVLSRDFDLRGGTTISHTAVLEIPGRKKLLGFTDGGVVVRPEPGNAAAVVENAAGLFKALGVERPRIALSGAIREAPSSPANPLWDDLLRRHREGWLPGAELDGPMPLECALDPGFAAASGLSGKVAGEADVFVVNSIEEGNIVAKALIIFGGAVFAGVITGAKVPVSLVSRTDPPRNKLCSLALACLVSGFTRSGGK